MATTTTHMPAVAGTYRRSAVMEWITTTDHKKIGIMYMVTAFAFFILAGITALGMRMQLALPYGQLGCGQSAACHTLFNEAFTFHGTVMVFFFAIPFLTGIANYVVPLQVGARDIAFPRINSFGFWLIPGAGLLLFASLLVPGGGATAGWTGYPPLTDAVHSPSHGTDLWAAALVVLAVSSIVAAVNFLTTIVALRAPGMKMMRMPLFTWSIVTTALLFLLAGPALAAALIMLLFDRNLGTNFFTSTGHPVLWQHLFWFYSHPAVYIMILPVFGAVSEIIPVFARKLIFGYTSMVVAIFSIAILALSVWAHHMFTVGVNIYAETFFMIMTAIIAVPTGIKFFNWLATAWGGSLDFKSPLLFVFGFLGTFLIGGITGVYLSAIPVDTQLHHSYYVVAHLHYVLFGGSTFGVFAAIYYWFPKMTGKMLNDTLGKLNFWTLLVGFNGTFLIMHTLGLSGMPRRIAVWTPDQAPIGQSWAFSNMFISVFAFLIAFSVLIFLVNFFYSLRKGVLAGANPWHGHSLEWATASPPPQFNFARIPVVHNRTPVLDPAFEAAIAAESEHNPG
ncbi:MAG: cytochrome c oxidase subunit I [Candidatus Dormibacteria bacterium]